VRLARSGASYEEAAVLVPFRDGTRPVADEVTLALKLQQMTLVLLG
jgi:hypothetical protein